MSGSCRFPEGRRLDGACNFILSNAKLRSQAKDIVDDFLSTNKGQLLLQCTIEYCYV